MKKQFVTPLFIFISFFAVQSFAQNSVFYGMTFRGGSLGDGAIISYNPTTNAEDTVHSFGSGTDGMYPGGSLVYDASNGLYYAMTKEGGSLDGGAIISFNPTTNAEDTVHCFGRGKDGFDPDGDLVYDASNGLFYAMTYAGGSLDDGAIVSFNPTTNVEDTVHSFGRGTDGEMPFGDLVYDASNGLFYGMTTYGGSLGDGAIISYNPTSNVEDTVHSFGRGMDGQNPWGTLIYYASNGLFYGMTQVGGSLGDGAIISYNPTTNVEDTVHSFGRGTDGQSPSGNLVYDAGNGLFYAMTHGGGSLGDGAIISYNPTTNAEDTVHSFGHGTDGQSPYSSLVYFAGTGLFYGMTQVGGSLGDGAIISYNPTTNVEDTVHSFGRGMDGQSPFLGTLVLYELTTGIDNLSGTNSNIEVYPNPTTSSFTLSGLSKGQVIELYNCIGQEISSTTSNTGSTMQLDISNQSEGIYLIRILNQKGILIYEQKVVKTN